MSGSDNEFDKWNQRSGNKAIEDPREKMLEKLRKLLEVQNRAATEAEAATAAGLLARFLQEHNLSVADLERRGAAAPSIREGQYDLGKAAWKWKLDLAEGIARFYYCAPMVDRIRKTVKFAGRPDNVEALTMLYAWVCKQIHGIATEERRRHFDETGEHIDPLRWQISFGVGATVTLLTRLQEMKARQEEELNVNADGDIQALTIHHESEVSDFLEQKYGYRVDGKPTQATLKWQKEWEESAAKKDALRIQCEAAGDMEPYYLEYPWDRPDTPEEIAAREKAHEAWLKKERKLEARRTGLAWRPGKSEDPAKREQSQTAKSAGKSAAGRINLQPFITGHVDNKKKVG